MNRKPSLLFLLLLFSCDAKLSTNQNIGRDVSSTSDTSDAGPRDLQAGLDLKLAEDLRYFDLSNEDLRNDLIEENARRYLSWNDGADIRIVSPNGNELDGYIRGGDFNQPIWAADDLWSWYMLHITEGGSPTEDFARVSLPTVTDRDGAQARVLKMALLKDAPNTTVEQIEFLEQQSAGKAGDMDSNFPRHTLVEPVFYQRQWIKFSPNTLARAEAIGAQDFYQIFWEMKALPDYRLRVQLVYDANEGLMLQAHDDGLSNSQSIHANSGMVKVDSIAMADDDSSEGWNFFEVWIDRTKGDQSRWRVRMNGIDVIDYTGPLNGVSNNIMGTAMMVQIYSDVTDLSTSPFSQMIDDIEIWDRPPNDAFQ